MAETANLHSGLVPVVINIDVEPDAFLLDPEDPGPWAGFEFCHDYFARIREQAEQITGLPVHFNWMLRMDPQIASAYGTPTWVVDRYQSVLDQYLAAGDGIGLHVHNYRWSEELDTWTDDSASQDWLAMCLQMAVDAYREAFGVAAVTSSFGNFFLSTAAVNLAEELGIIYEVTLEPGLLSKPSYGNRPQTAPTPSFTRVPREPYVPSKSDFRKPSTDPDSRTITLVPRSSAWEKLGTSPSDLRARTGRLLRNGLQGRWQSTPLAMVRTWTGDNDFLSMIERAVALQDNPYLAFTIRSNIHGTRYNRVNPSILALLDYCRRGNTRFCTITEAMSQLAVNAASSPVTGLTAVRESGAIS